MAASLGGLHRCMRLPVLLNQALKIRSTARCCSKNSVGSVSFSSDSKSNNPDANSRVSQTHSPDLENGLSTSKAASAAEGALDKFAKVVDRVKKAQNVDDEIKETNDDSTETFASMLRQSKLVSLGEHKGRLVQGEIIEVMEDDLYIDFGGKFHCVCPRPRRNGDRYHRGSKVLLSLQCMEMSSAFLGSDIHVTLLEADATLLGLTAQGNKLGSQRNQGLSQSQQSV